ncbi:LANO_0E15434g1_1 [Lachancea nothofagi CBS 11611]|uniref:LANO_0E15434g1_1 n=1 Tax=Lachancea nothofagi CBS 11611 TaxID=1266666 RepID=A0A1G4K116_9SACH|nr:LANO_0E15434g1_1 [Lachancea nothofagi CBS 11611]
MKSLLGLKFPGNSERSKVTSEDEFRHVKSGVDAVHGKDREPLKPLLILLDCQQRKSYLSWTSSSNLLLQVRGQADVVPVVNLGLRGTVVQLIVEPEANEYDNCVELDVANGISPMSWKLEQTSLVLNDGAMTLWCRSPEAQSQLRLLYDMCMLARFEYMSLFKALTATVISTYGSRISDISAVLLAQHSYKDWCYISIGGEWVKAWCHVDRSPKHAGSHKGHHQIKFFRDDKSLTSKNLLCFIPDCGDVEDLFFVEDQDPNIVESAPSDGFDRLRFRDHMDNARDDTGSFENSLDAMLSRLTTLRLVGDIFWPDVSSGSSKSRSSVLLSPIKKRTKSISTPSNSANGNAAQHRRSKSAVSMNSTVFHPDADEFEFKTSEILIKPIPHSGVHHLESLIRCALPMMGCLSLYGRPVHFKNSREDPESLLFGLPKLPAVDFFAVQELQPLFEYTAATVDGSVSINKTLSAYKQFLAQKLVEPGRDKKTFTTLSDMVQTGSTFSLLTNSSGSMSNSPMI